VKTHCGSSESEAPLQFSHPSFFHFFFGLFKYLESSNLFQPGMNSQLLIALTPFLLSIYFSDVQILFHENCWKLSIRGLTISGI